MAKVAVEWSWSRTLGMKSEQWPVELALFRLIVPRAPTALFEGTEKFYLSRAAEGDMFSPPPPALAKPKAAPKASAGATTNANLVAAKHMHHMFR